MIVFRVQHEGASSNMKGLYYRRKILLALLQEFGGELNNLDCQKFLFLLSEQQDDKSYEFVPYKFGCFSFQSYADKRALVQYRFLLDGPGWELSNKRKDFFGDLLPEDQTKIRAIKQKYGHLRGKKLIRQIYLDYPYYAINSEMAADVLSSTELKAIERCRPDSTFRGLFTIGYEGRTVENYLNVLIKNDVKVLCDVRKNPLSRKYGFSKNQLSDAVQKLGIKYVHVPELGVESHLRQDLEEVEDYKKLFQHYNKAILPKRSAQLQTITNLVRSEKRVAITCFEAQPQMCHRSCVAHALQSQPGWSFKMKDL